MRLVQLMNPQHKRQVALVQEPFLVPLQRLVSIYYLALEAIHSKKKIAEIEVLKNGKAKEINGRHVFPIYQKQNAKNAHFFVAIRTQSAGLLSHVIDDPTTEGSKNQIWNSYTKDLLEESKEQSSLEFDDALSTLEESTLVGFYVFGSKNWEELAKQDSELAPYFIADEDLVYALTDASPYFDNTNANLASDVDSYGVVFQASPKRSLALGKRLMKSVKAEEAARSSNKDL